MIFSKYTVLENFTEKFGSALPKRLLAVSTNDRANLRNQFSEIQLEIRDATTSYALFTRPPSGLVAVLNFVNYMKGIEIKLRQINAVNYEQTGRKPTVLKAQHLV